MLVDGPYLYVTMETDGQVVRLDRSTGDGLVPLLTGLGGPVGVAQDATSLYIAEHRGGRIRRYFEEPG